MKLIHRVLLIVLMFPLAIVGILMAALGVNTVLDGRAGNAFRRIEMGAPESTVVTLMGNPDIERPCGENLW
jgi:hypothetical protein